MADITKDYAAEVLEEIAQQPHVDPGHIGVSVHDGIVTLTGHVGSYLEKYEADKVSGTAEAPSTVRRRRFSAMPSLLRARIAIRSARTFGGAVIETTTTSA